jgi:hypothetical protein
LIFDGALKYDEYYDECFMGLMVISLHCLKLESFLNAINTNDNNHIVRIPWEIE